MQPTPPSASGVTLSLSSEHVCTVELTVQTRAQADRIMALDDLYSDFVTLRRVSPVWVTVTVRQFGHLTPREAARAVSSHLLHLSAI